MNVLYKTGIFTYRILAASLAPFSNKTKLFVQGRKRIYADIPTSWTNDQRKVAHFHTASLGEFEQARPVIEKFKAQFPKFKILLTFFSPSGYEVRKDYTEVDYVCYLPYDTKEEAQKFIKTFNPTISFFVKYEFWHYICLALKNNNTQLISFSSIFRENQRFFKGYEKGSKTTLKLFDKFFVQNELSKSLLNSIEINQVVITGDTRFDRVYELCQNPKKLTDIQQFVDELPCFVIGSSWKEDLEIIAAFLNKFTLPLKIIIAPHNITEQDLRHIEQSLTAATVRYSKLKPNATENILILDNMGMLSSVYQFATICHIGGGFKTGLHNTLEAATYGKPLLIGPHYRKFEEVTQLVDLEVCFSITSTDQFSEKFLELYNNQKLRRNISDKLDKYIKQNLGASDEVISYCKDLKILS